MKKEDAYDLAICKDPGGSKGILPVVEALRTRDRQVYLLADGYAKTDPEVLGQGGLLSSTVDAAIFLYPKPRVFITSMCSKGGAGRDLVARYRGRCPTVALQDQWGMRLKTDWADLKYRPDYIVTGDEVGRRIIRECWPDFANERIKTTGFPALDRCLFIDILAKRRQVRAALKLEQPDWPLVVFAGSCQMHTGRNLAEIIAGLNEYPRHPVNLVPRQHPRLKQDLPGEQDRWNRALATFKHGHLVTDSGSVPDTTELIAAADLVVGVASTVLMEAAALKIPTISLLYPDTGYKQLVEMSGGALTELPLVELGCTAKAASPEELKIHLSRFYRGVLAPAQQLCQKRNLRLDGQSARRVVDFIDHIAPR